MADFSWKAAQWVAGNFNYRLWFKNHNIQFDRKFFFLFLYFLIFINSKLHTFFINKHNSHKQTDTDRKLICGVFQ